MEPLRQFLMDNLVERPVELDEGEIITDAIVIYRIADMKSSIAENAERYKYSVTPSVTLASAFGMLDITADTMSFIYQRVIEEAEDDQEEEGGS